MKKILSLILMLALLLCACGAKTPKPLADGTYSVEVTLSGGSGRATILSPAQLAVRDGQYTVTLVWSSANYDYMVVDGVRYDPVTYEGGSTFQIPVKDLEPLTVIGDTVAMSTPHEIEYTLSFALSK